MTTMIAAGERGSKAGVADTEREDGWEGRDVDYRRLDR